MHDWPLNDATFVLLVLGCVAVLAIGSIVTSLTTVRRAEFSRLQNDVKQLSMMQNEVKRLSKKIKALEADEERRFLMELNKSVTTAPDDLKIHTP
jgi:peptidoglycan hydrolase CwlO-like protein